MASLEDLIATVNNGMHVGQQGNDLRELQAKLASTLHATKPPYRPIPPSNGLPVPSSSSGPTVPPAPASSWNDSYSSPSAYIGFPPPKSSSPNAGGVGGGNGNQRDVGFSIPPPKPLQNQQPNQAGPSGVSGQSNGIGMSDRRSQPGDGDRNQSLSSGMTGTVMGTSPGSVDDNIDEGFRNDAFRPLWTKSEGKEGWSGFKR